MLIGYNIKYMKFFLKILFFLLLLQITIWSTFAIQKIPGKLNSFDWILDVKEWEKINSKAKIIDLDILDINKKIVEKIKKNYLRII